MKKLLLLSTLVLGLASCSRGPTQPIVHKADFYLNLSAHKGNYVKSFEDIYSNHRIIPLKFKDSTFLTGISKLLVFNHHYYVLDLPFSQLYSFNADGSAIGQFGSVGIGNGEYKKISDFDILGDNVYIFSNNDKSIFLYDAQTGKFVKRINVGLYGTNLAIESTNKFLLFLNQNSNSKSSNYNVVQIDSIGTIENKYFPFDEKNKAFMMAFTGILAKSGKIIFFAKPFDDVIYKYDGQNFSPSIDAGIGNSYVLKNLDNLKSIFDETFIRNSSTSYLGNVFLKSNKYIVNSFQDSLNIRYSIYNIKNKRTAILRRTNVQDPLLYLMSKPLTLTDNQMIFCVTPESISYLKNSLPLLFNKLSQEDKSVLEKVSKKSNPLLLICDFK